MSLSHLYRLYVADNPMAQEGARALRRFARAGGGGAAAGQGADATRSVNIAILALLGLLYLWLLVLIVRSGEDMSQGVLFLELLLVTLVVPASLYAAISGERERLTWDALILTRLTPGQILVGKLLWRLGIVAGIALLFLPPLLFSHYAPFLSHLRNTGYGLSRGADYSLGELALMQGGILGWAFLLSGFTLWVSARTRRSVTSISLVAVAVFAFVVLVPALASLFTGPTNTLPPYILRLDGPPLSRLVAVLIHANPVEGITHLLHNGYYAGADQWPAHGLDAALPGGYAAVGFLCLLGAWRELRGLGTARRRS